MGVGRVRSRRACGRTRGPYSGVWKLSGIALAWGGLALAGCDTPRALAPAPPLEASSAALYAVDVSFPVPLERASAEDPSRYSVYPEGSPGSPAVIASASLIDTVGLRLVQLVIPAWFGDSATDRRPTVVETHGVRDWFGRSTGDRRASFVTGLNYTSTLRALLDAHCTSCHGASGPGGSYRTDSYAALFGPGTSPTPNVIAGDATSLLVVKCRPHNSMYVRGGLDFFDYERILDWVAVYLARE
jgi:hypothetical protein